MFGRKRIRELENKVEELGKAYREEVAWRKLCEQRLRTLSDREARHEMDVKERLDEHGTAIITNEERIRTLAASGERRTISDMVNKHDDKAEANIAHILDEYLNGKREGSDDE